MYRQIITTYNSPEKYSLEENKNMVSGSTYSIIQQHGDNAENPVHIERYHEDEYIYIYPNHAGDGLIFRDQAMRDQYEGYKTYHNLVYNGTVVNNALFGSLLTAGLLGQGDQEESDRLMDGVREINNLTNFGKINFDSFSIDLNSINIRPGTYVFVYAFEVPNHLRSLSVSLTDDPMSAPAFSFDNLSEEIKRLGLTFTVKSEKLPESEVLDSILSKEGSGKLARLIPSGEGVNALIHTLGLSERSKALAETVKDSKKQARDTAISNINTSFETNTASISQSITNVESDISSYTTQLSQVNKSISDIIANNPFVLQPLTDFALNVRRGQTAIRNQYSNLLSQRTSLTNLKSSSEASLASLQAQFSNLSNDKDRQIAALNQAYDNEVSSIDAQVKIATDTVMIPQSFRFSVPLNCRNSGVTKVCIYDHNKILVSASMVAAGTPTIPNGIASYRHDSDVDYPGTGNLIAGSWLMNYAHESLSDNEEYVSYYSINDRGVKTSITRAEYVTNINAATSSSNNLLSTKFEIRITPPEVSYLSSGQPEYDFSIIHSTTNLPYLKREIDEKKIFANPSIAIDFGETSGTERTRSLSAANVQQSIQGAYRSVTCFKVKNEGEESKYTLSWRDSSSKGLDLSKEYLKEKHVPKVVSDSLCNSYKGLEFNDESIALTSQSSVPEYSFDNGFSIFLVVRQNEEYSSDDSGINAMYPTGNIYKNGYLEIEWPDNNLDSSSILSYEPGYILSNIYQKRNLLYMDKEQSLLEIYDTKGIDRQADHLVTSSLSAYSAGRNDVAGYSKANFFEPDSYSIININYDGSSNFTWYKNGVLMNTSEAVKEFFKNAKTSTLYLAGLKSESEYNEMTYIRNSTLIEIASVQTIKEVSKILSYLLDEAQSSALDSTIPNGSKTFRESINASLESFNQSLSASKNNVFSLLSEASNGSFCGELSEMVIYSGEVSETVRVKTEGYLAEKFCLEDLLPPEHDWRYDTPPAEVEDDDEEEIPEVTEKDLIPQVNYNFTDTYLYTTDMDEKTGRWEPNWVPLSSIVNSGSIYLEQASWNRTNNTLTLHRSGGNDLVVNIDIFDTFVTEVFPINAELIPHFSSYVSSIFAYPTSSDDEQFSLAPAQKGFFDVLTFHSRSFPDLLWEKNAAGDTEIGGKYNSNAVDSTHFTKNVDLRTRSSYVWSGVVNKVGGSTATIRNGQKYYTESFSNAVSFTPSSSPIMVETSMDFNNGYKKTFLKSLNLDCMFTVARGWSDSDYAADINNFDAVGVRLITGSGKLYNLAFMIANDEVSPSKFSQLITSDFSGSKIIQGFEPLETRYISIDISNANNQYIEIESGEQYSLEFVVYLGKDGQAKLDTSNRPIQSGWFVSNVSFVASDSQK
jgi:hypothetical protein